MERDWERSRGVFPLGSQPKGLVYITVRDYASTGLGLGYPSYCFVRRNGLDIFYGALSGVVFGSGTGDGRGLSYAL